MIDAWIRVRANLSKTRVAKKLAPLCTRVRSDTQKAAGVLQDFWSGASQFSKDGFIRDEDDQTLEDWANWKGKPGVFANWVRTQHMDADGRINDWDEYMGVLESKRARDRERKRLEREKKKEEVARTSRGHSNGRHADVPCDVRTHDTERNVTRRNVTEQTDKELTSPRARKKPRAVESVPTWVQELTPIWLTKVGSVTHARLGKAMKPIVDAYGLPAVLAALDVYASADEGPRNGVRRVEFFASDFAHWHRIAQTPLVGDGGILTARGKRIGGAA